VQNAPTYLVSSCTDCAYYVWSFYEDTRRNPSREVTDYYLEFGYENCDKFINKTRKDLTPCGQGWLDRTAINLKVTTEDLRTNPLYQGLQYEGDFRKMAFEAHSPAYRNAGFIFLDGSDVFKIGMTPSWKHIAQGLPQILDIAPEWILYRSKNFLNGL
jgi:hypothetical protein